MSVTVLAGDHIISAETIPTLKRSLRELGSGISRTAYDLGNGSVLKVGRADGWAGGNRTEVEAWEMLKGSDVGQYLCPIIAYDSEDFAWLIMSKVDGTLNDDAYAACVWEDSGLQWEIERAGIGDLHRGNVGFVRDSSADDGFRFYVIDYAMNENRGADSDGWGEPSHCVSCCQENGGCSRHSWQGRPDACCAYGRYQMSDCKTLQGCNEQWCDAPGCGNLAHVNIGTVRQLVQARARLTLVWTEEQGFVCNLHKPVSVGLADFIREDRGQLPMFGRFASRKV